MLYKNLPVSLLEGFTPKQFNNKQEFLNYVGKFVLEELDGVNSSETEELIEAINYLEDVTETELKYAIFEENIEEMKNVHFFGSNNLGDGNPMEEIYVILDTKTKEYILVGFLGAYSSWDGYEYDEVTQIEFNPVKAYTTNRIF